MEKGLLYVALYSDSRPHYTWESGSTSSSSYASSVEPHIADIYSPSLRSMGLLPLPPYTLYYIKQQETVLVALCPDFLRKEFPFLALDRILRAYKACEGSFEASFKKIVEEEDKRIHETSDNAILRGTETEPLLDTRLPAELDEVREVLRANVDRLVMREDRLDLLVNKTDRINTNLRAFRRRTGGLKRGMWWANVKFRVGVAVGVLVSVGVTVGLLK